MQWRDTFLPSAAKAIDDADTAPLPNRAVPFIWHFVKRLKVPLSGAALAWGFAFAVTALEPLFIGGIIASITEAQPEQALMWALAYIGICQILARLCFQLGHAMENYYMPLTTMLVRQGLATYLHRHSYGFFQDDMAGRLAGKVIEMPNAVTETVAETVNTVFYVGIGALVSTVLLAVLDWRFGLLSACFYMATVLNLYCRYPELNRRGMVAAETINAMRGRYLDSISNILLVKLFARFKHEDRQLSRSLIEAATAKTAEQVAFRRAWGGQHILNGLFQGVIVIICLWGWRNGTLTTFMIATALPLSIQMATNIWFAISQATTYFSRFSTIQEGLDTILQPVAIDDPAEFTDWLPSNGAITIEDVDFAYGERVIFQKFSLFIPAGQRIGLIGPSGAGKSTLVQLLLRLHDVQAGAICIDGQDISKVSQDDLRGSIAMLPQQADLLHRSIADNIRYGRLEATDAEVMEAAKLAEAHDFIMQLPQGYESLVGERGVKLSGGQRQRIAIARAFIKNAPILILDEPTSALDSESEQAIQKSLAALMAGRTAIVIAHRLSTIAHLDRIVVLDAGRIVEDGSHAGLLAGNGLYARLWSLQTEGFLGETA